MHIPVSLWYTVHVYTVADASRCMHTCCSCGCSCCWLSSSLAGVGVGAGSVGARRAGPEAPREALSPGVRAPGESANEVQSTTRAWCSAQDATAHPAGTRCTRGSLRPTVFHTVCMLCNAQSLTLRRYAPPLLRTLAATVRASRGGA